VTARQPQPRQRLAVGFVGGPVLATGVEAAEVERVRAALAGDAAWHELRTRDGAVLIALARVAYLQVDREEEAVGFG
jgi:hypothetical protein